MVSNVPIDWPVGRRTSPYRLNTGMWWTGSVKSSDSTILSCLSPRRPCCGPNAAVTLSPAATSASTLWVRSRVTDAGWARIATREPSSGLRRSGSASSRSIPNSTEVIASAAKQSRGAGALDCRVAALLAMTKSRKPRGETGGIVEVGLVALGMGERPIGFGPVGLLENGGQAELPDDVGGDGDGRAERPPGEVVVHADVGRRRLGVLAAVPVAGEIIGGPLPRRGEVPFAVRIATVGAQECLEAGGLPQILGAFGFPR